MKFNLLLIVTTLIFLTGCGSKNEAFNDMIFDAFSYLEAGDCEQAITLLSSVDDDYAYDALYLRTLSSAYACKAGYNTSQLFIDIKDHFGNPSVLGGLSLFTTSSIATNPDNDESYQYLWEAINILLYAGGQIDSTTEPSAAERSKYFSDDEAGDINAMLLFLTMEELGKYTYYYGNVDSTGVKGSGNEANSCYFNYDHTISGIKYDSDDDGTSETYTIGDLLKLTNDSAAPTGACKTANNTTDPTGHPDLGVNTADTTTTPTKETQVARLCQGVVQLNTLLDTISGISGAISEIDTTELDKYKVFLEATAPGTGGLLNYDNCKTTFATDTTNLQIYFVIMFETLHQ